MPVASIPSGELAALGAATCWTASSLAFTAAGRRIGALSLNLIRLALGFALLTALCWIRRGLPLPTDAAPSAWGWLLLSGVVGFVFGDLCLFKAFILVGARVSMLVMALAPPIAAVLAWLWLDEGLGAVGVAGMALTLGGIAWVVLERNDGEGGRRRADPSGVALAFCGAVGQAVGLVLSKLGMKDYDPFAASQIRVIAGVAGFVIIISAVKWWGRVLDGLRDRTGMRLSATGAVLGPFLGVGFSLVAIQRTQTGVAATLMSTSPVLIIPAVILIHREAVSRRAILGALVAVAGVAVLWMRHS
ncbi:DMT family transporter [Sorangium sp. So ce291]|uniref:DMT family transporter n=1 Tax=Sorangium sp. So ce291 TaxID=3133294 RepID=UPI003F6041FC